MSELSNARGDGPRHPFKACGKDYSIGLLTRDIKIAFAKSLYARAREAVKAMRDDMDKAEHQAMFDRLSDEYTLGEFSMEGKRGQAFLLKPVGRILLLSLLIGTDEHEAMQILVDADAAPEVQSLLRTVLKESFPGVKDEVLDGDDPKKAPPG